MNHKLHTTLWSVLFFLCAFTTSAADRPNIVYIALEDITPMLGCYGDTYAKTPVFDKLAEQGIRYTHAYSVGPVCSVSRSSIVTGMYPTTLGTMHHRSNIGRPPAFLEMIPNLMREAGYYTTNNAKQDYNIGGANWNENGGKAHWRNRPDKAQPFFAKFDIGECHSSITKVPEDVIVQKRLNRLKPEDFHDPAKAPIPPYHPEDPVFRKAWSRYYDAVTQVDYRAGEIIKQLKEDGLWDDTIVIVWADHGVGMPRGKHTVYEQGTHVPLIIRYPKKYQHLATAEPGSVLNDPVCLMDMGPSVLKLAGIETPDYMHGRALLCQSDAKKRDYVVATRDRLDSRFEMVRGIRDRRYRYQRNFYPHLPYKPYEDFEFNAPVLRRWVQLAREGKLTGDHEMLARRFKPVEELYDSEKDPHMIRNVVNDPKYAKVLEQMRSRLHDWMVETRDLGILAEAEVRQRAQGKSAHWEVGQELSNYERILETANLQLQGEKAIPELTVRCKGADPAVRFWAVLGLAVVTQTAGPETVEGIVPALKEALQDESISIRLTAAEGLCNLGHYEDSVLVLSEALADPMVSAQIRSACILDTQPPEANAALQPALAYLEEAATKTNVKKLGGIPYGLNDPFGRARKAISGQANYYRWGMGASGSPKSSLMKVQESPSAMEEAEKPAMVDMPNIVLFLVDDMGLMDTSVPMLTDEDGNPKRYPLNDWYRTPNMERLAGQGTRFSNCYAHSLCSPSRISILTGQNSARHRNTRALHPYKKNAGPHTPKDWNWEGLKKGDTTLASVLKNAGYTTIHVGKGHLGPVGYEGAEPRNLGFDVNIAGANVGAPRSYYGNKRYGLDERDFSPHARPIPGLNKYHGTDTYLTEALTLEAKAAIGKAAAEEKPFFLYMSHYAVHFPFNPDARFQANYKNRGKSVRAQAFATMIEGVDKSLGDLMDHLEAKGVAENTLIVFLGDNGSDAPLGGDDAIGASAPLRGKKGTRWEGGMRVPFIAGWAKSDPDDKWQKKLPIAAGGLRREIGTCFDLFPTITELVGASVPADHPVDGQNLVKLLSGKPDPAHRNEFLSHYPHLRVRGQGNDYVTSYRRGPWKVVYHYAEETLRYELYELENDPTESKNLAASKPEKLRTMMQAMVRNLEAMEAQYPVKDGRPLEPVIPQLVGTTKPGLN